MPAEDDIGRPRPRSRGKGIGTCTPRHHIYSSLDDHDPDAPIGTRRQQAWGPDGRPPSAAAGGCALAAAERERRLKRAVFNAQGEAVNFRVESTGIGRETGIRCIDFVPARQKGSAEGAKRCFPLTHRPTGYENPDQWEDPVVPGVRPSHPVSANGVVALERRRVYPDVQWKETGIPPRLLSKAPHGKQWGGWSRDGAPGRGPLRGPWDSMEEAAGDVGEGAAATHQRSASAKVGIRFADARVKHCADLKHHSTFHLTRWHVDPHADIDPLPDKRLHLNQPTAATFRAASEAVRMVVAMPAAGKPSGLWTPRAPPQLGTLTALAPGTAAAADLEPHGGRS